MKLCAALLALCLALPAPAVAANSLITPGTTVSVAKSPLTVTADREWNRLGRRGRLTAERWTIDGLLLNELVFYGGIANDMSLYGKLRKTDPPVPVFKATMLITDIPAMFESTYRLAAGVTIMSIDRMEPVKFAGNQGIRFTYDCTLKDDDVPRKGEVYAAIVDGRLYMITFEAPALHFFDAAIASARAVVASATIAATKK
jgi:hypothetical protein